MKNFSGTFNFGPAVWSLNFGNDCVKK